MSVAIIPARGGSRRIPRKNIRLFHGEPIIAYSIKAALCANVFGRVWVSTEDQEIAEVAVKYGANVLYRPLVLAEDGVGTQVVMQHAVQTLGTPDWACCIYPCAPLLEYSTLRSAFEALTRSDRDYIVPIGTWLRDPGQFYMGRADAFREDRPLVSPRTGLIAIDEKTDCDINTEEDWVRAEGLYLQAHSVQGAQDA